MTDGQRWVKLVGRAFGRGEQLWDADVDQAALTIINQPFYAKGQFTATVMVH